MKPIALLVAAGAAAAVTLNAVPVVAQATRTFVSGQGSDSNPCSLAAPCRSFAQALTQTAAGGEIAVLDTAGYGTVTINKAVSITNQEGVEAGITTSSFVDAVTVAAGASDVVNLRGLTVVGGGVGNNGITFSSGAVLNIQNCVIRGFTNEGIKALPSVSSTINVTDTVLSNNTDGVFAQPAAATTTLIAFERVQALGNSQNGLFLIGPASGTFNASAADSLFSGNNTGIEAAGSSLLLTLVTSKVVNDHIGLFVDTGATMFLGLSTVSGSTFRGFDIENGGVLKTYGNNFLTDSTNLGSLTPVSPK